MIEKSAYSACERSKMKPSAGFGAYFQEQLDNLKSDIEVLDITIRKCCCCIMLVMLLVFIGEVIFINQTYFQEMITQSKETNIQLQHINEKLHMMTVDKGVDRLRVVGP